MNSMKLRSLIRLCDQVFHSERWFQLTKTFSNTIDKSNHQNIDNILLPVSHYLDGLQEIDLWSYRHPTSSIGFMKLHETSDYEITVFSIPPDKTIPLHDHPGMVVLTKVLNGSLNVECYTKLTLGSCKLEEISKLDQGAISVLYPVVGNLHQFYVCPSERESCVVLDIISPKYDDRARPCSFFSLEDTNSKNIFNLTATYPMDYSTEDLFTE